LMVEYVSGFCPTQGKEYEIEARYNRVAPSGGVEYFVRVGADCEYLSFDFSRCPIYKDCPLLAKAPKELR
jgi:hypothetical protein